MKFLLLLPALVLAPVIAIAASDYSTPAQARTRALLLRSAGKHIFSDPSFSASGKQSCASCHDPAHRYSPPNAVDVQPGGANLAGQGLRAPPTLTYLNRVPPYDNHYHEPDEEGDESVDNGPTGGLTWDGRVDRSDAQARLPLTSPFEMANTPAGIAAAARRDPQAQLLRAALGADVLANDDDAVAAVVRALAAFEEDYAEFSPYTSKFDAYLTGHVQLGAAEKRGLALFESEDKGNCMQCHRSRRGKDGTPPAFSDYGLIALAVPRNANIARNRDPVFFDLGACGPERQDKTGQGGYCGLFRTPTLRNVALRSTFFHNGKFHDLREVVEFYVTRDITPERWYGKDTDRKTVVYDDLPPRYHANINRDPPFAGQRPGAKPALTGTEIDDIVAFLYTLTDGYLKDDPYRAERRRAASSPNAAAAKP